MVTIPIVMLVIISVFSLVGVFYLIELIVRLIAIIKAEDTHDREE